MSHAFNKSVHGARGLFCLSVFGFHVINSGLATFPALQGSLFEHLARTGKYGVELFFGISGIVIVGTLARARSLPSFLYDRYARILPVLWASLVVLLALRYADGRPPVSLPRLVGNFLAAPPLLNVRLLHPAAWSLGYEFTFYWLCALAVLARPRRAVWSVVFVPASIALLACYPRALLMVAGVLIARRTLDRGLSAILARYPTPFLALYLVTWRALEVHALEDTSNLSPLHMPLADWLLVAPLLLMSAVLGGIALLGIERGHGALGRCLSTREMQWLGTISYSFYLWHPLVMALVKQLLRTTGLATELGPWSQLAFGVASLPPSLAIAHLSQRVLEVRITRLLKNWAERQLWTPLVPAEATLPHEGTAK